MKENFEPEEETERKEAETHGCRPYWAEKTIKEFKLHIIF
jgi:hypothetical protein